MNLNKLQYFLTVYEEGSITNAAKKHFITQVSMTQQIKSLEEELGITLFVRDKKKKLVRTLASDYLYENSKKLLSSYSRILEDIKAYAKDHRQLLRIGINYYSLYEMLKKDTRQFEELFPNVHITFHFRPSNELITELDKDQLDIIVIWEQYVRDLGLFTLPAFTSRAAVLLPMEERLPEGFEFSYNQLAGKKAVFLTEELPYFRRTGLLEKLLYYLCEDSGMSRSDIIISDNINEALLLCSEQGIPILTFEDKLYKISIQGLYPIVLDHSLMEFEYCFAWKPKDEASIVSSFISYCKKNVDLRKPL